MKKINLFLASVVAAATLSLSSCTDDCKDVVCENGGTCNEGTCECPTNYYGDNCEFFCENGTYADGACGCDAGYEGESCSTESREKFVSSWNYTTSCAPGESFTSAISNVSDNVQRVTITNLTGFNDKTAYAVVDGSTINIPSQTITDEDGDSWTVSSNTATIANGTFTLSVEYSYAGNTSTCPLTYTK